MKADQSKTSLIGRLIIAGIAALTLSACWLTDRRDFTVLLSQVLVAFGLYAYLSVKTGLRVQAKHLLWAAIGIRIMAWLSFPNLSDDIYRFIWDGLQINQGNNPFAQLPADLVNASNEDLYNKLNSPEYFTIYPPVLQLIFALATFVFPNSWYGAALLIKLPILVGEIGTLLLIQKLLKNFELPQNNWLWYAFNPLVIIEFSGNCHFEGLMVFFMALAIYLLSKQKGVASAFGLAAAVCTKLLPLMFLPALLRLLKFKNWIIYCSLVGVVCIVAFLPFLDASFWANFGASLDLYFRRFEFNASLYFIGREIGTAILGYNPNRILSPSLMGLALLGIILVSFLRKGNTVKQLMPSFLFIGSIYLACAAIVHPWYIGPIVFYGLFTKYRFAMLWSATAYLSYYAYSNEDFTESMWLVGIEYGLVLAWWVGELFFTAKTQRA